MTRFVTLLLATTGLCIHEARAQIPRADTLPMQHHVIGSQLPLNAGALIGLRIDPPFRYAGGQRFNLYGIADAEQHFFVVADSAKRVQKLFWIQIEGYLPDRSGTYDYSADSTVTVQGLPFRANVSATANRGAIRPGSDREWMMTLLYANGYQFPAASTRLRLIYLPDATKRREIMIVYLEPTAALRREKNATAALLARASAAAHLIK